MRNKIFAFNLLLSFSSLFAADKSYKILSTEIQTTINKDGTIDFTESREFRFNGDFSYVFQDIPKGDTIKYLIFKYLKTKLCI